VAKPDGHHSVSCGKTQKTDLDSPVNVVLDVCG
jgi:hypothetical protein